MPEKKERPDPNKSLVGFVVGKVRYAVSIGAVREIINPTEVTQLPHLPDAVAGVADHRGEVIPVLDLRRRFGLPPASDHSRTKWILVDVDGKTVGLVVDQVTDVFGTAGDSLRPAPALGAGDDTRGLEGVITHDGALTFVLDLDRFETVAASIPEEALLAAAESLGS